MLFYILRNILLYAANTHDLICLFKQDVSLMTLFIYSSLSHICAEGNVLSAVREKIWALMCLIVLLWFPDGFENFILIIFSSCLEATELKKQQFHILMFPIISFFSSVFGCDFDILGVWRAHHEFAASFFASVWCFVKYCYKRYDVSVSCAIKLG